MAFLDSNYAKIAFTAGVSSQNRGSLLRPMVIAKFKESAS